MACRYDKSCQDGEKMIVWGQGQIPLSWPQRAGPILPLCIIRLSPSHSHTSFSLWQLLLTPHRSYTPRRMPLYSLFHPCFPAICTASGFISSYQNPAFHFGILWFYSYMPKLAMQMPTRAIQVMQTEWSRWTTWRLQGVARILGNLREGESQKAAHCDI